MARKPYVFHSLSSCSECGVSGDDFASPNVEAYEVTGELICDDCADTVLERLAEDEDDETNDEEILRLQLLASVLLGALKGLNESILGTAESNASGNPNWEYVSARVNAARAAIAQAEGS